MSNKSEVYQGMGLDMKELREKWLTKKEREEEHIEGEVRHSFLVNPCYRAIDNSSLS
jgi:hypothetical protein